MTALSLAMVVLAVGETALSPTAPALANDLAPDAPRGRYNGVYTLAWSKASLPAPRSPAPYWRRARPGRCCWL